MGYQASLYAMELLGVSGRAQDEELVCVTENDACGVDAVQAVLGCTVGKGNLIFRMTGKQAFNFLIAKAERACVCCCALRRGFPARNGRAG